MTGNTWKKQSLGGSETAAAMMCRHLAARGHEVRLYCNCPMPGIYDGVRYQDVGAFQAEMMGDEPDILVMSRSFHHLFGEWLTPKFACIWNHDILFPNIVKVMDAVWPITDRMIFNSEFHKGQVDQTLELVGHSPMPDGMPWVSRNGVDMATVEKACKGVERDPRRMIYTSRPDRGLDVLCSVWPKLKQEYPELQLHLAWYSHPEADKGQLADMLRAVDAEVASLPDVHRLPPLKKVDLYRELAASNLLLYPSIFWETSCIAAIEAMACGVVPISSRYCALKETILDRKTGVLVPKNPRSPEYQSQYVFEVGELLRDPGRLESYREEGIDWARGRFDYRLIAAEWEAMFYDLFDSQPARERHKALAWKSDVLGARANGHDVSGEPGHAGLEYGWTDDEDAYRKHYESSYTGPPQPNGLMTQDMLEPRLRWLLTELSARLDVKRILDMGCSFGEIACMLEEASEGAFEIVAADANEPVLRDAQRLAHIWTRFPEKIDFRYMPSVSCESAGLGEPVDAMWLGEILEHIPEPDIFLGRCLDHVRPGGWVFASVPWGPWDMVPQEAPYRSKPWAGHLHHLGRRDLAALLSGLEDVQLTWAPGLYSSRTCRNEPVGFWLAVARKPKADVVIPVPDLTRRARLTRGRQGISACILVGGPAENSLHRSLRSIRPFVDQICLSYSNATPEARRIGHEYADHEQDIPWLEEDGMPDFGAARNLSVQSALEDWILWIDTDEVLKGGEHFWRLCRRNHFLGYIIPQIHVQLDASIEPDLPVRLYRNGMGIRFYGAVHEHPETAMNQGIMPVTIPREPGGDPLVRICHDGYLTERDRRQRYQRNLPLLKKSRKKYPGRKLDDATWFRDWVQDALFKVQANGGQVTPDIRKQLGEALQFWHQCGLADPKDQRRRFVMRQYEHALHALGAGFEVRLGAQIGPRQAQEGPRADLKARVMDVEEAAGMSADLLRGLVKQLDLADFHSQFPFEE